MLNQHRLRLAFVATVQVVESVNVVQDFFQQHVNLTPPATYLPVVFSVVLFIFALLFLLRTIFNFMLRLELSGFILDGFRIIINWAELLLEVYFVRLFSSFLVFVSSGLYWGGFIAWRS